MFFCSAGTAQVLIPLPETAFELNHNFNPEVIRNKGIKKITYEIMDKKDFQVAVDKSLTEVYEFNANGQLARYYFTTISKTIQKEVMVRGRSGWERVLHQEYLYDTVSTSYFYQNKNLVLKRYHDGLNYYESRYYSYDTLRRLTKEKRYKETNNSADRTVFILGNQVLLSEDSFQYQSFSSGQTKCIFLNNENRPYKETICNYDSAHRLIHMEETYTAASWIRQEQWFGYRYDGKLQEAKFTGNAHHEVSMKTTYEYDEYNELFNEKRYRNELLLREISYVRDRNNGLLNSFIIRDPSNKSLRIVKLKYEFGSISKIGNRG